MTAAAEGKHCMQQQHTYTQKQKQKKKQKKRRRTVFSKETVMFQKANTTGSRTHHAVTRRR